jgi:hypothetical protein
MTARGYAMVPKSKLTTEEIEQLEERAKAAAQKSDDRSVNEFLKKFEKDYRANIKEREKGSSK